MPLGSLCELLLYAEKRETEQSVFPLWLVHYLMQNLSGQEAIPFDELMRSIEQPENVKEKTSDEILEEFSPIIEADKRRGEGSSG